MDTRIKVKPTSINRIPYLLSVRTFEYRKASNKATFAPSVVLNMSSGKVSLAIRRMIKAPPATIKRPVRNRKKKNIVLNS